MRYRHTVAIRVHTLLLNSNQTVTDCEMFCRSKEIHQRVTDRQLQCSKLVCTFLSRLSNTEGWNRSENNRRAWCNNKINALFPKMHFFMDYCGEKKLLTY